MTGTEIAKLLLAACEKTGLKPEATNLVMLNFGILWGEQLGAEMDRAIFTEMTAGIDDPDGGQECLKF